ncbi:uncharacterized protein [Apostichopus japonicus]|uniref:uncharacterized protein n=1 Tax=Stichopus japonicus TaxID=307972 RepID=UPI003AB2428B
MWVKYDSGKPITSKRVTRCISACWTNAGFTSTISTTLLRKTIVSKCFEEQPHDLPTLASHMTHTEKVQQKYYLDSKKRQNAVDTADVIRSVTQKSKTPTYRSWAEWGRVSGSSSQGKKMNRRATTNRHTQTGPRAPRARCGRASDIVHDFDRIHHGPTTTSCFCD